MFCLEHKTTRHSAPRMEATFQKLTNYMAKNRAHEKVANRHGYAVPDMMGKGVHLMMTRGNSTHEAGTNTDLDCQMAGIEDDEEDWGTLPDDLEVGDDGSLDV